MTIEINISATIWHEYADRCPSHLPLYKLTAGRCRVTIEEAQEILADARFNSDRSCVDVGRDGMPVGTFRAYAALAAQISKKLAAPPAVVAP